MTPVIAIVSDDIEFVGSYEKRMFSQSLNYNQMNKSKTSSFRVDAANEKFKQGMTAVHIMTPEGSITFDANTCSPKEALANFIPAAEMSLKVKCGTNRLDAKEADIRMQITAHQILENEPSRESQGQKPKGIQ